MAKNMAHPDHAPILATWRPADERPPGNHGSDHATGDGHLDNGRCRRRHATVHEVDRQPRLGCGSVAATQFNDRLLVAAESPPGINCDSQHVSDTSNHSEQKFGISAVFSLRPHQGKFGKWTVQCDLASSMYP